MNKRNLLFIPLLLASLGLAGCASDSKKVVDLNVSYIPTSSAPTATNNAYAQQQLAGAANSVDHSLQQLSAMQLATNPGVNMGHPMNARKAGLSRRVNLSWNGPAEPALARVAALGHYKFRVLGTKPAIAVLVNVNANNSTLSEIVRNIRYQVSGKASVAVYPASRVIELRYDS